MSIIAAELIAYCSANHPEDDVSTYGGAIDPLRRLVFTDLAANDDVEVLSSSAGDTTQTVTVYGRKADGSYVNEVKTLTGTTAVIFSTIGVLERIERVEMSATAAGIITVRRSVAGATIATIPVGERGFRRLFVNAFSDPVSTKNYYEKIFLKNTNGTLALLTATVKQNADPTGKITHLIAGTIDDTSTVANRLTAPGAGLTLDPDTFDDLDKIVLGSNLAAASAIGVYLKLALGAAEAPIKSTYTIELQGSSI